MSVKELAVDESILNATFKKNCLMKELPYFSFLILKLLLFRCLVDYYWIKLSKLVLHKDVKVYLLLLFLYIIKAPLILVHVVIYVKEIDEYYFFSQ